METLRTNGATKTLHLDNEEVVISHVYENDKPNYFVSKAGLDRLGLKLAPGQLPVAFTYNARAREYLLYNQYQAIPKRKLSAKQLATLDKARQATMTCRECGQFIGYPVKVCDDCTRKRRIAEIETETKFFFERLTQARNGAVDWAKSVLADSQAIILCTKTTGHDSASEVIQLVIMRVDGTVLLDQLIHSQAPIPDEASMLHHITNQTVTGQPAWPELHDQVEQILQAASLVIMYNAESETRFLTQTARRYNLTLPHFQANCAMELYAQYYGEWSDYYNAFRWQKLVGGQSALADSQAILGLLREMANG